MTGRAQQAERGERPWKLPNGAGRAQTPFVIGIAGGRETDAAVDVALLTALRSAERMGARTLFLDSTRLGETVREDPKAASRVVDEIARADGVILAGSAADGSLSDPLRGVLHGWRGSEGTASSSPLRDKAVACIVAASSARLAAWGLTSLRSAVHELGGWPTPMGVAVDLSRSPFHPTGTCARPEVGEDLAVAGAQVVDFALARRAYAGGNRHIAA